MTLRVGQRAPDFDLTSSSGKRLRLADFLGKKNVVLYFYPADFTFVCTRETCGFRDAHEELASHDTEVIGVSSDSNASHERFAKEHNVPFELVADEDRELAKRYDATGWLYDRLGKVRRVTYVIDKKGEIAGVFDSALSAQKHVSGVRELVQKLSGRASVA